MFSGTKFTLHATKDGLFGYNFDIINKYLT